MTQKVRNNNKQKLVESRGGGGQILKKWGEREKDGTWSIPRRVCKGRRRRISRRNTKSVIQFLNKTKQNPPKKFRIKWQNKLNFKKLINNKKRVEKFRKVSWQMTSRVEKKKNILSLLRFPFKLMWQRGGKVVGTVARHFSYSFPFEPIFILFFFFLIPSLDFSYSAITTRWKGANNNHNNPNKETQKKKKRERRNVEC